MTAIPIYQVDAFTSVVFRGNPAAVCPLTAWPGDAVLQAIAAENNLSETAYLVEEEGGYRIRWFTPVEEVPLCGHATLASAWVVFHELRKATRSIRFSSRSGFLDVNLEGDRLVMNLPAYAITPLACPPDDLLHGLAAEPVEVLEVTADPNLYAMFRSEDEVRALNPDFKVLARLHPRGVVVSAPGDQSDCASRYFAPGSGIPEDPVTGSVHCALVPYWSRRLGKTDIHARQVSARGGELFCRDLGERVEIAGHAVLYLQGSITIPE